jgi:uncharacterized alpha-E superfamily protein
MISRVAEQSFWLHRYLERLEGTARLLDVNLTFLLDTDLPELARWHPILIASGEEERYAGVCGLDVPDDGERIQAYLVWDERTPVSMWNSLQFARDNARIVRDTISLETWTAINGAWIWLQSRDARRLYREDRHAFYAFVRESCQQILGVTTDTMLHDEPFDFMRMGMFLERAGQTIRILDIKYHSLGVTTREETAAEAAQWLAILRACSAVEPFFKRTAVSPTGPAVAEFLLLEPAFPRTVMHCVTRAWHFLRRIRSLSGDAEIGTTSVGHLQSLLRHLRGLSVERLLNRGIHRELLIILDRVALVSNAISADYFQANLGASVAHVES